MQSSSCSPTEPSSPLAHCSEGIKEEVAFLRSGNNPFFPRAARTHVSYPPDPVTSKCHSVPNSSRSQRWKILPIVLNEAIWLSLHLAETNSSLRRHRLENLHLSRTALKALGMSIQHCSPTPVYNSASRPRAAGVQHDVTWLTQPRSRCNEPKDVSRQQNIFGNRGYLGKLEQSK
jgi:hypothetical protein